MKILNDCILIVVVIFVCFFFFFFFFLFFCLFFSFFFFLSFLFLFLCLFCTLNLCFFLLFLTEKHKSYHVRDEQLARDGFRKFLKHEECSIDACRSSRVCNHIHCIRPGKTRFLGWLILNFLTYQLSSCYFISFWQDALMYFTLRDNCILINVNMRDANMNGHTVNIV